MGGEAMNSRTGDVVPDSGLCETRCSHLASYSAAVLSQMHTPVNK